MIVPFFSQRKAGLFGACVSLWGSTWALADQAIQFNRDIRPILSDNCFACHGFDAKHRKADLRLDNAEGATAKTKEGKSAIVPGDPTNSELWRRITSTDADEFMPPPETHKTLKPEQKDLLRRWIEQGAPYQKHWSFEAPVKAVPPEGFPGASIIDRFLEARLAKEGISPNSLAEKETIIRRATIALTGLPPTPAEVEAFLADSDAGAYERVVDRLLKSPRYGEQMARHWLDVARYGDTHGLHLDNERSMWLYRDWVVKAFNENLPFDQFTIEQLAGDLLPQPTNDQLIATGFNRCNVTTSEGGSIDAEYIYRYAVDRTSTTALAWMGLTAGCAVCHDHKFDPISHEEFYSLYAFFNSAADPAMDGNNVLTEPTVKRTTPEDLRLLDESTAKIQAAEKRLRETVASLSYEDPATAVQTPPAKEIEAIWLDDAEPAGGKSVGGFGHAPHWVTAENGRVFSGKRALKRQEAGITQDVFEGMTSLEIPAQAKIFVHVYLEPSDPPKAVMLQFNRNGWHHRAVWGEADAISWGDLNTTQRRPMGALPELGKWVRLEVEAERVGLKEGDKLNGLAFTQFGGTVFWDKCGVQARMDPARDASYSLSRWLEQNAGKEIAGAPGELSAAMKKSAKNRSVEESKRLREYYLEHVCAATRPVLEPIRGEIASYKKQREEINGRIPATFIFRDLPKARESFAMLRGKYDKPGKQVQRGVPAILPKLKNTSNPTRLDLAQWLVAPEHPLTPRVAVNRLWQQFFGVGLVKTSGDFGSQGESPSHPELLDWLAVEFRESGWDTKKLVKLLLMSAAFQRSAKATPEVLRRDPENRLLARGPRFRMDAEEVRDNALFLSGLMDHTMGGKGVRPYQPDNIWEPVGFVGSNTASYTRDKGPALYRRSLYVFLKRTAPPPFMVNFDAPNREQFCAQRERSNTPLQALQLMNDVQHCEAARAFAERIMTEGGVDAKERVRWAYRSVLARLPSESEMSVVQDMQAKFLAKYTRQPESAKQLINNGESKPKEGLPTAELAAWTMVGNLLLNLDETITR